MKINIHTVIVFAIPLILLLMTVIAGTIFFQYPKLSLPISKVLAIFTFILPLVTGASLKGFLILSRRLLKKNGHQTIYLAMFGLITIQIIYETIIGTLSLTYVLSDSTLNCGLQERWQELFSNKDERAIRAIQDKFDCCGLNSIRDRAWPFSSNIPSRCAETFGRSQSCLVPWRGAEKFNGGLMFLTVIGVFLTKVFAVAYIFTRNTNVNRRLIPIDEASNEDNYPSNFGRLLIKDNNPNKAFRNEPNSIQSSDDGPDVWNLPQEPANETSRLIQDQNEWVDDRTR